MSIIIIRRVAVGKMTISVVKVKAFVLRTINAKENSDVAIGTIAAVGV